MMDLLNAWCFGARIKGHLASRGQERAIKPDFRTDENAGRGGARPLWPMILAQAGCGTRRIDAGCGNAQASAALSVNATIRAGWPHELR
jgi:hypothetical protein